MELFKSNKIFLDSETVAEQLRSARQERGLKIEAVAEKLNINKKYLEALEKGKFDQMPAGVYSKKFLKEYAIFLGLDYNELVKIFQKELDVEEGTARSELFSKQVAKAKYFLATPKIIKNLIVSAVILACLAYLAASVKNITAPPFLFVESPQNNIITNSKSITVNGKVEAESEVIINGKSVLSDSSGNFSEEVSLKDGINIIIVTAKKKYSREAVISRQILVKNE
jgi:cytoskeletal protein RodZ